MAETASSGDGSVERETMADGPSRKRERSGAPVLTDDLVQWEILYRLPAKDILRCRATCRSWHRLSCDEEFLLAHHRRQPSLPLVSFQSGSARGNDHHAAVDALDVRRTPAVRRAVLRFNDYNIHHRSFTIHGSCDGLLLISLASRRFYLCNPATRGWLALPALTGGDVAALYHHRPSGEHRVLFWKRPSNGDSFVYYVLPVGSSEGPRSLKHDSDPTTHWAIRAYAYQPALLHGCLHWYVCNRFNKKVVLVFDTEVESFRLMQSPMTTRSTHLLQMDGTLGISDIYIDRDTDTMIAELWVLQDYRTEVWSSKYRVELPVADLKKMSILACNGKVVSEKGDMLVTLRLRWAESGSSLLHYDGKGKLLGEFKSDGVNPMALGFSFKESLVRHAFFNRKHGGRVPRFFRGL